MTRTDITLNAWITKMAVLVGAQKGNPKDRYNGKEGALALAGDIAYAFHDFPKTQWAAAVKASWKVALSRYGKTPPINESVWEARVKKTLGIK